MKILTNIVATIAALGMLAPIALAESQSETRGRDESAVVQQDVEQGREQSEEQERSTARLGGDNATTTGEQEREHRRSQVAEQVQRLLQVADRDDGIGDDVREVAHEYASSTERADVEKQNIESRPAWMTFLVGAKYKNLGALRREVAKTENSIDRLTKARDRATDATVKATLDAQVQALAESASSTEVFIRSHESAFSIFGWFFRIFNR